VNPAPSPRQTPSRPPSRQSTRITTPVQTNPDFVRPSQDSRKSLSQCNPPSRNPTNQNSEDKSDDEDKPQSPVSHPSTQVSQSMNLYLFSRRGFLATIPALITCFKNFTIKRKKKLRLLPKQRHQRPPLRKRKSKEASDLYINSISFRTRWRHL
ncbi:hypothetical protein PSHT_13157, partial [Puccinia striiformis]